MAEMAIGFLSACLLIVPYRKGWLGGGDVKLMMAYGTLLGFWSYVQLFAWAALFSIIWSLACSHSCGTSDSSRQIPYAIPLSVAVLVILAIRGDW